MPMAIFLRLAKGSVGASTLAGFLFNIWELVANTVLFTGFLLANGVPTSIYCYDYGTGYDFDLWYDIIFDVTIIYYFYYHSLTGFTWKNTKTIANLDVMWYQREYWSVIMEVEILKVLSGGLIGFFEIGLFGMKSIKWHLMGHGFENVSPIGGGGGGGVDVIL